LGQSIQISFGRQFESGTSTLVHIPWKLSNKLMKMMRCGTRSALFGIIDTDTISLYTFDQPDKSNFFMLDCFNVMMEIQYVQLQHSFTYCEIHMVTVCIQDFPCRILVRFQLLWQVTLEGACCSAIF
jgi:hypothetical protein